jgi:hypothetical protein
MSEKLLSMRKRAPRSTIAAAVAVVLFAAVALAVATAAGAERGDGSPKVIQLSYFESSGDQGADRGLEAFARHTHAIRFATSFHGHEANAPGRYRSNITDTDIKGHNAKHPWSPNRKAGGKEVIRLVHRSLHERGFANVRLRARKRGEVDKVRAQIDRSRCHSDPPLYPVDCEVQT